MPNDDRRTLLRQLLKPTPTTTPNPSTSLVPRASAGERNPFPRKSTGKLLFPSDEFKKLLALKKSLANVSPSAIQDPKIKAVVSAATDVSELLSIDASGIDVSGNDSLDEEPPRSAQFSAMDQAIEGVLAMTKDVEADKLDFESLQEAFNASYQAHLATGSDQNRMTYDLDYDPDDFLQAAQNERIERDFASSFSHAPIEEYAYLPPPPRRDEAEEVYMHEEATERTDVARNDFIFALKECKTRLAGSIIFYDSCATRCFDKTDEHCIPGTVHELENKPKIKQASCVDQGHSVGLQRCNVLINELAKTVISFIVPPMICPGFTDPITIYAMSELKAINIKMDPGFSDDSIKLMFKGDDKMPPSHLMGSTPSGMPYFTSLSDDFVISNGYTRLNVDMAPYSDLSALEDLMKNGMSLFTASLRHDNLKQSYVNALESSIHTLTHSCHLINDKIPKQVVPRAWSECGDLDDDERKPPAKCRREEVLDSI